MKNGNKIKISTRILLLAGAVLLVFVLYTPIWRIELNAPQYPEGLSLQIYANGLRGNVDIINGLNHYIGMKTLHNEDFIEFSLLPWLIGFFAIAFVLVALQGKRKIVNLLLFTFIAFGIIAIIDFWRWEYNYGHNLNPNAAIVVPGMAYQPPLIGFKQLLNFGAYSIPDTGGWLFIGAGLILLLCAVLEWKTYRKSKRIQVNLAKAAFLLLLPLLNSCTAGPEPIKAGVDNCSFCKMTVTDMRYGAELITTKGKIYKFDEINCIVSFINSNMIEGSNIKEVYLADYTGSHTLAKAGESFLIRSEAIHGPMNGNIISFSNADSMKLALQKIGGTAIFWNQLMK